jgi:hypothetical protein
VLGAGVVSVPSGDARDMMLEEAERELREIPAGSRHELWDLCQKIVTGVPADDPNRVLAGRWAQAFGAIELDGNVRGALDRIGLADTAWLQLVSQMMQEVGS